MTTGEERPYVSVIIPTFDRPGRLRTLLAALTRLRYPKSRLEVVVVDDGSSSPVEPALAPFEAELQLVSHRQERAGPATARNLGARQARGVYLAFIDDDCVPAPGWLDALVTQFARTPGALLGGRIVNAVEGNLYSATSQLLLRYLYTYYESELRNGRFFASSNMAAPAGRFLEVGGFDTRFPLAAGEDRDLCDRWLQHGYELRYVPDALVHHAHDLDLTSFWRQHFNYGRGAYYYRRSRAERGRPPLTVEPPSFYVDMLRYPMRSKEASGSRAWLHAVLLALSQVANAAGFFWEASRQKLSGGGPAEGSDRGEAPDGAGDSPEHAEAGAASGSREGVHPRGRAGKGMRSVAE